MWSRTGTFPSNPVATVPWVYGTQAIKPSGLMRRPLYSISVSHASQAAFGSRGNLALICKLETRVKGPQVTATDGKGWDVSTMLLEHVWRKRKWIRRFNRVCVRKRGKISTTCRLLDRSTIATPHGRTSAGPSQSTSDPLVRRRVGYISGRVRSQYPVRCVTSRTVTICCEQNSPF